MCLASVAWAREDSVAGKELATVVVTASRLQELEREALSATTVISSQAIRNRRLADLPSVLRSEAGIEFDRMGGPGMVTSVFMRGSNANRVLVQLDGVPVTDGAVVCRRQCAIYGRTGGWQPQVAGLLAGQSGCALPDFAGSIRLWTY